MTKKIEHIVFDRPWYRPVLIGTVVVILDFSLHYLFQFFGCLQCMLGRYLLDGVGVAAFAVYLGRAHRRRIRRRVEELQYLNHHVRNAVQMMLNIHLIENESAKREVVLQATGRIVECIRQITEEEGVQLDSADLELQSKFKKVKA